MVHATCIAFDGKAILLRGSSGSGKSDLAIRALAEGARLIAADQVVLTSDGETVQASAPHALRGMIEVHGLGIIRVESDAKAPVALVVDLSDPQATAADTIERMPECRECALMGVTLPWFKIAPFQASAVSKLRLALIAATSPGVWVS